MHFLYCDTDSSAAYTSIFIRGPTKSDFRYRYIATKIPYRPGIPSTILYYRSRKYARINIDVYAAELSVSQYKKCMKAGLGFYRVERYFYPTFYPTMGRNMGKNGRNTFLPGRNGRNMVETSSTYLKSYQL